MTKDRKDSTKKQFKKPKTNENPPNKAVDTFSKSQQNVVAQLKKDLQNSNIEVQKSLSLIVEKNKCIVDLEKSLQERDSEIEKLHNDLNQLKEENIQTLKDFSLFRDKFYELETHYDKISQILNQEIHELKEKINKYQTDENSKIQELSSSCNDLQEQLHDKSQAVMKLNEQLLENMRNFDQMKKEFERQQNDFELYKSNVEEEKRIYDDNNNIEFAKLKDEIIHKDEIIKQCLINKESLEKEKNHIIEELNYKIRRIERAFTQPTKVVQPMVSMPNTTNEINSNQKSNPQNLNDNVAIAKPQVCEQLENDSNSEPATISNENKKSDSTTQQRQYKFKRPTHVQPISQNLTAASTSNANNNKKRRQPARKQTANLNLPATANLNEFSSTSSDEDESDDSIFHKQWRPKPSRFVPDSSDASEGFAKSKRFKK